MPGTWAEVSRRLGFNGISPHVSEPAIMAGAYYMASLRKQWSAPRPEADRHSLALASYNAGLGNLLKAQTRCGGVYYYGQIIPCLPKITGDNAKETTTYVKRIWGYFVQMVVS